MPEIKSLDKLGYNELDAIIDNDKEPILNRELARREYNSRAVLTHANNKLGTNWGSINEMRNQLYDIESSSKALESLHKIGVFTDVKDVQTFRKKLGIDSYEIESNERKDVLKPTNPLDLMNQSNDAPTKDAYKGMFDGDIDDDGKISNNIEIKADVKGDGVDTPFSRKLDENTRATLDKELSDLGIEQKSIDAFKSGNRDNPYMDAALDNSSATPDSKYEEIKKYADINRKIYKSLGYDTSFGLKEGEYSKGELEEALFKLNKKRENDVKMISDIDNNISKISKDRTFTEDYIDAMNITRRVNPLYTATLNNYNKAKEILSAPYKENSGFWKGFADAATNKSTWTFGIPDMLDSRTVGTLLDRYVSGEELNANEMMCLDAAEKVMLAQASRSDDMSMNYGAGSIAGNMLPFMLDVALTGGLVDMAAKGASKVALKGASNFAKSNWGKYLVRKYGDSIVRKTADFVQGNKAANAVYDVTKGTVKAATRGTAQNIISPSTIASTVSAGDTHYEIGDNGDTVIEEGTQQDMVNAWLDSGIEYASEGMGEPLEKTFGYIGKSIGNILPKGSNIKSISNITKCINPKHWGSFGEIVRKSNIQGMPFETMEEVFGTEARYCLGLSSRQERDDFYTTDNFKQMTLGFSLMNAVGFGTGVIGLRKMNKSYLTAKNNFNIALKNIGFSSNNINEADRLLFSEDTNIDEIGGKIHSFVESQNIDDKQKAELYSAMNEAVIACATRSAWNGMNDVKSKTDDLIKGNANDFNNTIANSGVDINEIREYANETGENAERIAPLIIDKVSNPIRKDFEQKRQINKTMSEYIQGLNERATDDGKTIIEVSNKDGRVGYIAKQDEETNSSFVRWEDSGDIEQISNDNISISEPIDIEAQTASFKEETLSRINFMDNVRVGDIMHTSQGAEVVITNIDIPNGVVTMSIPNTDNVFQETIGNITDAMSDGVFIPAISNGAVINSGGMSIRVMDRQMMPSDSNISNDGCGDGYNVRITKNGKSSNGVISKEELYDLMNRNNSEEVDNQEEGITADTYTSFTDGDKNKAADSVLVDIESIESEISKIEKEFSKPIGMRDKNKADKRKRDAGALSKLKEEKAKLESIYKELRPDESIETPIEEINNPKEDNTESKNNTDNKESEETDNSESDNAITAESILEITNGNLESAIDSVNDAISDIESDIDKTEKEISGKINIRDSKAVNKRNESKKKLESIKKDKELYVSILNELEGRKPNKYTNEEAQEDSNDVPDWTRESVEDSRNRGYRIVNGYKVERQKGANGIYGNDVTVSFSNKKQDTIKGKLKAIEADNIQASNGVDGANNPNTFLNDAQPKDRTTSSSMSGSDDIANNIRPSDITESSSAFLGRPTVNKRGEVIQGNNRVIGLKKAYSGNKASEYKQYLIDNADRFGLDKKEIDKMRNPILVTEVDVPDKEAVRLGNIHDNELTSGGNEQIKPKNVIGKLGDRIQNFVNILLKDNSEDNDKSLSELISDNGVEAIQFLSRQKAITNTEFENSLSNGRLTDSGRVSLRSILKERLFDGAPLDTDKHFYELPSAVQKAILLTSYIDEHSKEEDRILSDIQQAINAYCELESISEKFKNAGGNYKDASIAVEDAKKQTRLYESGTIADNYNNFALELAISFKDNNRKSKKLENDFKSIYETIQGKQGDLLNEGVKGLSKAEAINKLFNIEYNGIHTIKKGSSNVASKNERSRKWERGSNSDATSKERDTSREQSTNNSGGDKQHDRGGRKGVDELATDVALEITKRTGIEVVTDENEIEEALNGKGVEAKKQNSVLGFALGGKIYLHKGGIKPNTPIHEFTHIWDSVVRIKNPNLWKQGVDLMKKTSLWKEVCDDKSYEDIKDNDDLVASEVHSRLTGVQGESILRKLAEEEIAKGNASKDSVIEQLKQWIGDVWNYIKDTFAPWSKEETGKISLEDFVKMPIVDLVNGKGGNESGGDIRFSISQRDSDYKKAVESGDMETAQRMVDEVAENAFADSEIKGKFYHNTPNKFTVFDKALNGTHNDAGWLGDGFYFYGDENEGNGYGETKMTVYLNIQNPYFATPEENEALALANNRDASIAFTNRLIEDGYDGVYYDGDLRQEAVVFDANQIKSADPVTYDDRGNVIPLSKRFSEWENDIRFQYRRKTNKLKNDKDAFLLERVNNELSNSILTDEEKNEIQKYIESLPKDTNFKNGEYIYIPQSNVLYRFNTSLEQYSTNRRDGRDGFEITRRYNLNKLSEEQSKEIKDGIKNRKDIDSVININRFEFEGRNSVNSSSLLPNRKSAINNDRLDKETLQGKTDGRGSGGNSVGNQGTSQVNSDDTNTPQFSIDDKSYSSFLTKVNSFGVLNPAPIVNRSARSTVTPRSVGSMSEDEANRRGTIGVSVSRKDVGKVSHNERKKILIDNLIKDAVRSDADMDTQNIKESNPIADWFKQPMLSFDTLLRKLGRNAPNGEGLTWRYFNEELNNARDLQLRRKEEITLLKNDKADEIMGTYNGKGLNDLYQLMSLPSGVELDIPHSHTFNLTQSQCAMIYAWSKQEQGKLHFEETGITDEKLAEIEDAMSPEAKEWIDWVQDELLPLLRDDYADMYKELNGKEMPKVNNYFPLRVNKASINEEETAGLDMTEKLFVSTTTSASHDRTNSNIQLNIADYDAVRILEEHIAEQEQQYCYGEIERDVNDIMRDNHAIFQNIYRGFRNDFFAAACLAVGKFKSQKNKWNWVNILIRGVNRGCVGFKPYTAIKQLASLPLAASYGTKPLVKAIFNAMSIYKGVEATNWALKALPQFRDRLSKQIGGDSSLELELKVETLKDIFNTKHKAKRFLNETTNVGMYLNKKIDAFACGCIAKAVYDTSLEKYKKAGLSDAMADADARRDAINVINLTQQSSEGMYIAPIQRSKNPITVGLVAFQNATYSMGRLVRNSIKSADIIFSKGKTEKAAAALEEYYRGKGFDDAQASILAKSNISSSTTRAFCSPMSVAMETALYSIFNTLPDVLAESTDGDNDDGDNEWATMFLLSYVSALVEPITNMVMCGQFMVDFARKYAKNKHNGVETKWTDVIDSLLPENSFTKRLKSDIGSIVRNYERKDLTSCLITIAALGIQAKAGVDVTLFTNAYAGINHAVRNGASVENITYMLTEVLAMPKPARKEFIYALREDDNFLDYINRITGYCTWKNHMGFNGLTEFEVKVFKKELFNQIIMSDNSIRKDISQLMNKIRNEEVDTDKLATKYDVEAFLSFMSEHGKNVSITPKLYEKLNYINAKINNRDISNDELKSIILGTTPEEHHFNLPDSY